MLMFSHRGPYVFLSPSSITMGYRRLHNGSPKPVLEGGLAQSCLLKGELSVRGRLYLKLDRETYLHFLHVFLKAFNLESI